jgi:hypothetical protein
MRIGCLNITLKPSKRAYDAADKGAVLRHFAWQMSLTS